MITANRDVVTVTVTMKLKSASLFGVPIFASTSVKPTSVNARGKTFSLCNFPNEFHLDISFFSFISFKSDLTGCSAARSAFSRSEGGNSFILPKVCSRVSYELLVVTAVLAVPLLLVVSGVVGLLEDINPLVEVVLHLRAETSEDDEARLLARLPLVVVMVFVARTVKAMLFALRFISARLRFQSARHFVRVAGKMRWQKVDKKREEEEEEEEERKVFATTTSFHRYQY